MSEGEDEGPDPTDVVGRRTAVLETLAGDQSTTGEVADRTGVSRSTANRAVRELEAAGLVERASGGYRATTTGELLLDRYRALCRDVAGVAGTREVLQPLSPATGLGAEVLAGAETYLAAEPAAYRPVERLHDLLAAADRYRAVLPVLEAPRHARLLYEHAVVDGDPAELVADPGVLATLQRVEPRRAAKLAEADPFEARLRGGNDAEDGEGGGKGGEFGLVLAGTEGEATVAVVVYGEHGTVHGLVENDADRAVQWAREYYADAREEATPAGDRLAPAGGANGADSGRERGRAERGGDSLPPVLEAEGFVRLSSRFFIDRRVADPTTAWRTGLDLAEVQAGYAVDRHAGDDTDGDRDRERFADRLGRALRRGEDCLVVGPPGSGKSTACKQVACDWYREVEGPVLYREGGRGRPFAAVDALERVLDRAEGHALVVVEDAVRPEAAAALTALERVGDREDVSVLLDARESEWHDPPAAVPDGLDLRVETVPRLLDRDCERVVEHFERTADVDVDVPVERLREELRQPPLSDGAAAPNEVLLLLHRLSRYADPLADGRTTLEEAVEAAYEAAAGAGEAALDAAVLVNLLNAAGLPVGPVHVRAVAGGETEAAIDALDGRVLFGGGDGDGDGYRTVHEAWSVVFLSVLFEDGESAARERVGRVIDALLGLAEGKDDRLPRAGPDGSTGADDPTPEVAEEWVADIATRLVGLGRSYPKLAPLLGDGDGLAFDLPAGAPVAEADLRVNLGRAFLDGGLYRRAEAVFDSLPDAEYRIERLLGLSRAARERGAYDAAADRAAACLERARETDRPLAAARACLERGRVALQRGEFGTAREHLSRARGTFARLGEHRRMARCLDALGRVAQRRSAYRRAEAYHEWALRIRRERGDRRGEAVSRKQLGTVAFYRGEYDRARDRWGHSLDVARWLGDRQTEAEALNNLAIVAMMTGDYDRAHDCYEESLAASRAVGDRQTEATVLQNLGEIAEREGDYDRAHDCYEESLAISQELGDRKGEAASLHGLGKALRRRGAYERAREVVEESIAIRDHLDDDSGRASARTTLAAVAREQGRYDEAEEILTAGLETVRDVDDHGEEVYVRHALGETARLRGDADRAREHLEASLTLARDLDNERVEARALHGLAALNRQQGALERARDRAEAALETFEALGDTDGIVRSRLVRGRIALEADRPERARRWAENAHDPVAGSGNERLLARTRRLRGRVEAAAGEPGKARDRLRAALEAAESVGAADEALRTLERLVEVCRDAGDREAARRWRRRAAEAVDGAPAATARRHEWVPGEA